MKYKILAFDIDGTLTNQKKEITPATKSAIARAKELGTIIVIASGRPIQGIRPLAKELGLYESGGYILALNGGMVVSCQDETVIHNSKIPMEYYREIYDLAKANQVNLMTYEGDAIVSEDITNEYLEIEARINGLDKKQVHHLCEFLDYEVNKFLMLGEGSYLAEVEKKVYKALSDRMDVYRSEPFFLEVLPKNVHKGKALEKLLESLGLDREDLMAFGDGFNDLTMIEYAGMGVAMSNGNEMVKAKADLIAPSNEEDGVAQILNKFMLD